MDALSVHGLTKSFQSRTVVKGINFTVREKSVFGLLGPNGAGKTTTLRMLTGLSQPDSGHIKIEGKTLVFGTTTTSRSIGYLPEQPAFYPWMSGLEYLQFCAHLYSLSPAEQKQRIESTLKQVDLYDARRRRIGGYSNGMKQRLGIAQAILHRPSLLILDEPVSALDPIGRREVMDLIGELKKESAILMSTHILSDVDRLCDDVAILKEGSILVQSPLAELKASHAKPILEVEFRGDPHSLCPDIEKQEWVSHLSQSGSSLKIWLSEEAVRKMDSQSPNIPLSYLSSLPLGVLRYSYSLPQIEDLFIDLVK